MLLSQRIVKEPGFLEVLGPLKTTQEIKTRIRQDILHAPKVLIGDYGIGTPEGISMGEMRELLFGHDSRAAQDKREDVYHQFARTPFPTVALESEAFVLLVRGYASTKTIQGVNDISPGTPSISVTSIDKYGIVGLHESALVFTPEKSRKFYQPLTPWIATALKEGVVKGQKLQNLLLMSQVYRWIACDVLTLMNCRNIEQITYTPTKRELAHLPKVLQSRFVYHILDIQRSRKVYTSMEEITQDAWHREERTQAKAHIVRGHFKKTRTGVFWWNHFLRNAKNLETQGFVDKDYRIEKEHDQKDTSTQGS